MKKVKEFVNSYPNGFWFSLFGIAFTVAILYIFYIFGVNENEKRIEDYCVENHVCYELVSAIHECVPNEDKMELAQNVVYDAHNYITQEPLDIIMKYTGFDVNTAFFVLERSAELESLHNK